MNEPRENLRVSSPGRICLFGEHQDYLDLPVISMAVSLRITIEGKRRRDQLVRLRLPDVGAVEEFSLEGPLEYRRSRDYFRSAVNVLRREGFAFSSGLDCVVRGDIPIKAGVSSSSALVAAWVDFLARMSDESRALSPEELARLAHHAEVIEFEEPGGMMDQYTAAFGGLLFIAFHPGPRVERLPARLGPFVLGDSREPKDTMAILARVRTRVFGAVERVARRRPDFSLQTAEAGAFAALSRHLDAEDRTLLAGTLRTRDITREALALLRRPSPNPRAIGALLDEHQALLRDTLGVSTPKMERMMEAARRVGAVGAKITGSGGGGCMFAYAPEDTEAVARAIEEVGGTASVVQSDEGTRAERISRSSPMMEEH